MWKHRFFSLEVEGEKAKERFGYILEFNRIWLCYNENRNLIASKYFMSKEKMF